MVEYIREKRKVLRQFKVSLTGEQIKYLNSLKSEIAIDNFITPIIVSSL